MYLHAYKYIFTNFIQAWRTEENKLRESLVIFPLGQTGSTHDVRWKKQVVAREHTLEFGLFSTNDSRPFRGTGSWRTCQGTKLWRGFFFSPLCHLFYSSIFYSGLYRCVRN